MRTPLRADAVAIILSKVRMNPSTEFNPAELTAPQRQKLREELSKLGSKVRVIWPAPGGRKGGKVTIQSSFT